MKAQKDDTGRIKVRKNIEKIAEMPSANKLASEWRRKWKPPDYSAHECEPK